MAMDVLQHQISAWLRVIRVRFLLASVIAVSAALALAFRESGSLDIFDAALTMGGVIALHASVDLLNDYWDYKRGIDTATRRTKMSGGTGVLPEGLLRPQSVYRAGILFLILGASAGAYFVATDGPVVAAILGFAIVSIYFYSTTIVNVGLGELFVAIKGCMIVVGTFYIQHGDITLGSVLAGIAVGSLSSLVLFAASFPDYAADKSGGRRTLVILLGRKRASGLFWLFPAVAYGAIAYGVVAAQGAVLPAAALASLGAVPLAVHAGLGLARQCMSDADRLVAPLTRILVFGRVAGVLFVLGIAASVWCPEWCR